MELSYWDNCRGYSHPIRMLLEYCEEKYVYTTPKCGPAPFFDKKEWLSNKYKILAGYDFPNLSYLRDGDTLLTHHIAIMQYLGRKYGLYPITEQEHQDVDMLREQVIELKDHLINTMCFYSHREKGCSPSEEEIYSQKVKQAPLIQMNITDIGRKYKKQGDVYNGVVWMAGQRMTYIDFIVYEQVDYARNLFPGLLDFNEHCANMDKFMLQFEQIPTISSYIKSERFEKFPFYAARSFLGTSEETCYKDMKCNFGTNN